MIKIDVKDVIKSLGPNADKKTVLKAVSQKFKEEFEKEKKS